MDGLPAGDGCRPRPTRSSSRAPAGWSPSGVPTGAPGRTTVAVGVATELAAAGTPTLLADADVYGGVVAQVLGFLDEAPGLAAAARLANNGQLDVAGAGRGRGRRGARPAGAHRHLACRPVARAAAGRARAGVGAGPQPRGGHRRRLRLLPRAGRGAVVRHGGAAPQRRHRWRPCWPPTPCSPSGRPTRSGCSGWSAGSPACARRCRACCRGSSSTGSAAARSVASRRRSSPRRSSATPASATSRSCPMTATPSTRALLQARALCEVSPESPARRALAGIAAGLVGRPAPKRKRGLLRR